MPAPIAAAVYLRVSSKDGRQDEANQEPACARLCEQRGWVPVFFRERESGAKARPEWARVVESARLGKVGAVVFWALDRVGRSRAEICRDIEALGHFNVHVASVADAWLDQQQGPMRTLMLQIMAWVAEGERARLIERTRAGLDRARARGVVLGRPRRDPAPVQHAMWLHRNDGLTIAAAARTAGIPRATLRHALGSLGVAKKGGPV